MKSGCFDITTLAEYIDAQLSAPEKTEVEAHLAECDECMETFAVSKRILADMDLTEQTAPAPLAVITEVLSGVRRKAKSLIRWATDLRPPVWFMAPALSPVRSGAAPPAESAPDALLTGRKLDDLYAELYVQKRKADRSMMAIRVMRGRRPAQNVSITLSRDGGSSMARFLNKEYEVFDRLLPGSYLLRLEQDACLKGVYRFELDDEGFHEREDDTP